MPSSSPSSPLMLPGRVVKLVAILALSLSLGACDYISSFNKPKQTPEEAKAEGIALGAGCRLAGQSLEDCYQRNPNSLKAGIFAGWKDMHEYMAAKNIPTATSTPPVEAEKTEAVDPDAGKDERTLRRERRERERAEREKASASKDGDSSKSKSSDSKSKSSDSKSKDSDSPRKSRDDGSSKK
jgi:type IV secretory pathway VirB10-like protein